MSRMTRALAVGAAAASMVLLGGCVTTSQLPEGGMSRDELLIVRAAQLDVAWERLDLPDEIRPAEQGFTVVPSDEWAQRVAGCMSDAGYDNYGVRDQRLQIGKASSLSEPRTEAIDFFVCRALFQRDLTDGVELNRGQRDYLYDYYLTSLVPCLELQGVQIEDSPTRDEFAASGVGIGWNPYYAMDALSFGEVVADDALLAACPSFPSDSRFDDWRSSVG